MQKEVLIIIPAYNEEKNISGVLDSLEKIQIPEFADVLVMNDSSSDNTNFVVKRRKYALVTHVFNLGYGSALQLGYKYAVRRGYRYVIQMDADGQHDVCNIKNIYDKLRESDENGLCPDIVLGSRYVEGSSPFKVSAVKKFAYNLFGFMIFCGTGRKINDPTTGLQGLSYRTFLYYSKYNHFDDKYPDANIIMHMLLLGYRVAEIPAVMHRREFGTSMHSGLKPVVYMMRMTFSMLAVLFSDKVLKTEKALGDDDVFIWKK
ncbi:MAG: glycosyltransferase family 2 protein [Lachnospira sp.]|nr:glycosyltransferase family 2 protein [Lachnospira sp.]